MVYIFLYIILSMYQNLGLRFVFFQSKTITLKKKKKKKKFSFVMTSKMSFVIFQ